MSFKIPNETVSLVFHHNSSPPQIHSVSRMSTEANPIRLEPWQFDIYGLQSVHIRHVFRSIVFIFFEAYASVRQLSVDQLI